MNVPMGNGVGLGITAEDAVEIAIESNKEAVNLLSKEW
jgi:hypothetical protein